MVDINIEEQIAASLRTTVESYLKSVDLDKLIADTLQKQVGTVIANLTNRVLGQLLANRDLEEEVATLVKTVVKDHLLLTGKNILQETVKQNDFTKLITSSVQQEVHRVAGSYEFPNKSIPFKSINFDNSQISATLINNEKIPNFNSTGISDNATSTQMTLSDDGAVIENLLVGENLFAKNLVIEGDLSINGEIETSESLNNYIKQVSSNFIDSKLNDINSKDIDLSNRNLVGQGRIMISNDALGPQIVNSNLRKVGNLLELVVSGQAIISETLVVSDGKVGINTEEARGALTVWDEDSEFSLVKISPKNIFAGSTRNTDVSFGTNFNEQIKLKNNGEIELIGPIRFNGILVNVSNTIPEHIGEPGELSILKHSSEIYRCIGQNKWSKVL